MKPNEDDNAGFVGKPGSGLTDQERTEVSFFKARRLRNQIAYERDYPTNTAPPVPPRPDLHTAGA